MGGVPVVSKVFSKPKPPAAAPAPVAAAVIPAEDRTVQATEEMRQRAARTRARRTGRPLLGPGGAQRDEELQTTLGAG